MPRCPHPLLRAAAALATAGLALLLAGCAVPTAATDTAARLAALGSAYDVLLLGEQHDAPDHHRIERETVQALAAQGRLAALALEMAEEGTTTVALPRAADEGAIRAALRWNDSAWRWGDYGPAVVAAVRAGVPVIGANLPRGALRLAMQDVSLDAQLAPDALARQQDAIRDGHCGLLPAAQTGPMTRVQIARDRAMAHALAESVRPPRVALLIAGAGHVDAALGVPQHLPADLRIRSVQLRAGEGAGGAAGRFDAVWTTPPVAAKDYCAELRTAPKH
ncbi:ChaN family lipoprotein [Xylophilus sp.]|uniref:ChaN family lipoprotein n=1 Tax=Xylophilus sp. TaxID=2653893 RepID=UPI0013BE4CA1|nr:ChaN family lipoprotein [Xylophilus sp.]KAF1044145.1 MAG: hypothetical protein GAK38_03671 [Xylophilus sp.]